MNTANQNSPAAGSEKKFLILIAILSIAIPVVVAMLFFMPKEGSSSVDVSFLPTLHAILNSLTAFALVIGYYNIRKGNIRVHRNAMATAFGLSAVFLVSYVTYHFLGERTIYGGDGFLKLFYYFILLTHIVLAVVIVPLVLLSMYFAFSEQFVRHRRISKWTFPIWLYVAITGVLVYILISPYYS
ncbi:DUF420 domain-containing protein [uncultured Pontibacter sp.]|uniref:DUF420 domain-containing protein n=1 Tax=uncultured Pontibacter sp. TaxID=453356 RepID=UPI002627A8D0|nr:DUF420 domain-containing protein [uncultured Pontibacter sp.]